MIGTVFEVCDLPWLHRLPGAGLLFAGRGGPESGGGTRQHGGAKRMGGVSFRTVQVVIYPNQKVKPPVGSGLNKASTIKLCPFWTSAQKRHGEKDMGHFEGTAVIQRAKSSRMRDLALKVAGSCWCFGYFWIVVI